MGKTQEKPKRNALLVQLETTVQHHVDCGCAFPSCVVGIGTTVTSNCEHCSEYVKNGGLECLKVFRDCEHKQKVLMSLPATIFEMAIYSDAILRAVAKQYSSDINPLPKPSKHVQKRTVFTQYIIARQKERHKDFDPYVRKEVVT